MREPEASVRAEEGIATRYRWTICALLFYATSLNYFDRQILGVLAPLLERDMRWSEAQYGFIVTAFQVAYGLSFVPMGRLIDAIGTRLGYVVSVGCWGLASLSHTLASSASGFAMARFALGIGEAGNFPAAIKTVAEVFPEDRRALATGVFNSGSNLGAVLAPALAPWLAYRYGWRSCFLVTAALGTIWIGLWLAIRKPQSLAVKDGARQSGAGWTEVWRRRELWALALARFLTDPVWWFLLYWTPKFLESRTGVDLRTLALPLVIIYLAADGGSLLGGWLSSALVRRGHPAPGARKRAMLACALLVLPVAAVPHVSSLPMLVLLLSCGTAGHQGWAANIFTLVSDYFPRRDVASAIGICGSAASAGGALAATAVGLALQFTGSYTAIFTCAGFAYLLALALLHALYPGPRAYSGPGGAGGPAATWR